VFHFCGVCVCDLSSIEHPLLCTLTSCLKPCCAHTRPPPPHSRARRPSQMRRAAATGHSAARSGAALLPACVSQSKEKHASTSKSQSIYRVNPSQEQNASTSKSRSHCPRETPTTVLPSSSCSSPRGITPQVPPSVLPPLFRP